MLHLLQCEVRAGGWRLTRGIVPYTAAATPTALCLGDGCPGRSTGGRGGSAGDGCTPGGARVTRSSGL